jgi:hypothetical protein
VNARAAYPPRPSHTPSAHPVRLVLLATLAVSLSACDAGADEPDRDPLLGTWDLASQTEAHYGTVSVTQTALDFVHPGTGEIAITGDVTATLRQLYSRIETANGEFVGLQGWGARQGTRARVHLQAASRGGVTVEVYDETGLLTERYSATDLPAVSDDGVAVDNVRLVGVRSGAAVTVNGALTFARATYVAGVEAPFHVHWLGPRYVLGHRALSFSEGGALESTFLGNGPSGRVLPGTWSRVEGDSLRLVIEGDPVRYTGEYTYTYAVDAVALSLTSPGGCNSACVEGQVRLSESSLGLEAGTVVGYRLEEASTYSRSGPEPGRP